MVRPRSRWGRVLVIALTLIVVAAVGGYWWQRPLLLTGTGYAAHNACAVTHLVGRDNPADDLPANPLVPFLHTETGDASAPTTVTLLGALARQRAWYTPGYGCTLADSRPDLPAPATVDAAADPYADQPVADDLPASIRTVLDDALDHAFGTDLPAADRDTLGTRAVVVLHQGQVVAERYAAGFDASTPQLGWSMTKSVTNLIVGRLVQEGKVGLDDDHLVPSWTDDRAPITVRELLGMTSGLAWDEAYTLGSPVTQMLYREPDMGAYVASRPLAHPPGTRLQYSTGSPTLLCAVLADRTGLGADLARRTVFAPLGLASAVLEPDASGHPVCGSYLWATARDWAALGQFALQDGVWQGERLLPEGWMTASTTASTVASSEDPYGLGWWVNRAPDGSAWDPDLPADAYFAEGHDGQWIVVVPSADLVVVRLGFTAAGTDDRALSTAARLVRDLG